MSTAELVYLAAALGALALGGLHLARPSKLCSPLAALRGLGRRPAGRWLVLLAWWWLGWHLFAR